MRHAASLDGTGRLHAVTLLETVYASAIVDQLLLTGVERMALGADIHAQLLLNGTGLKGLTADAVNSDLAVIGMDLFLHGFHLTLTGLSSLRRARHPINHTTRIIAQCPFHCKGFWLFLHRNANLHEIQSL